MSPLTEGMCHTGYLRGGAYCKLCTMNTRKNTFYTTVSPHLHWFHTIKVVVWQGGGDVLPEALQRNDLQRCSSSVSSNVDSKHKLTLALSCLVTLWGWHLAQFSSLAKTPSLHSMIQCSSMGKDSSLVAAMAMPKPISRTRPPTTRNTKCKHVEDFQFFTKQKVRFCLPAV